MNMLVTAEPNWTQTRTELLRTYWREGNTVTRCADLLGGFEHCPDGGVNAVKKKLQRLGWKHDKPPSWTPLRLALLNEIYTQGSFQWIADEINKRTGSQFTRNAICGQAMRSGLMAKNPKRRNGDSRKAERIVARRARRQAHAKPRPAKTTVIPMPIATDVQSLREYENRGAPAHFLAIAFRELNDNDCRYPYDVDGVTMFCGQPKLETSSYCLRCHPLCWRPVEKRRAA